MEVRRRPERYTLTTLATRHASPLFQARKDCYVGTHEPTFCGEWVMRLRFSFLPLVVISLSLATAAAQDHDLAKELPRIRPTEPAEALATFRIRDGFRFRVVATEPLVADPVAACYDA